MFFLVIVLIVNGVISFFNAKEAGKVWAEAKGIGGWIQVLAWCAAIQSALGFTYIYVTILVGVTYKLSILSYSSLLFMSDLAYLFIIIPLVGSGLVITIHSWIQASREKSLAALGIAGWNTFAQAYNAYHMIQSIGPAFELVKDHVTSLWNNDDSDSDTDEDSIVILLVIAAVLGGIVTTMTIMNLYTASLPVSTAVRKQVAMNR